MQRIVPLATFPYGTLLVNLLGCLTIGLLAGLAESRQLFGPEFRMFVFIGVLGSFTTFSTFGYETFAMLRDADYMRAAANVGAQIIIGLTLVWLGYPASFASMDALKAMDAVGPAVTIKISHNGLVRCLTTAAKGRPQLRFYSFQFSVFKSSVLLK